MILGCTLGVVLVLTGIAFMLSRSGDKKLIPPRRFREEAGIVAEEYRRRAEEQWRKELIANAAKLLAAKGKKSS